MSKKGEKCKSRGANCAFEITLLQAIMLTLLLVCAFFSTQVQKYLAWVYNKDSLPGDSHVALLLRMTNINPQRAKGTHRATRCIAFADRQKHRIIAFATGKTAFQRFPLSNSLTSPGFSGILALRVSRTVASQDEESPSITRQGAGEIPVKATSRKVQQRYTARFIV